MLPPPGVPLLIWSMSWSRVRRVPTVVRSGRVGRRAVQGVAVAAVLVLEHQRPLQLQRACCAGPCAPGPGRRSRRSSRGDQGDVTPW